MPKSNFTDHRAWKYVLFAAIAGAFTWLFIRNLGLHPYIFADEWFYSKMSRLMPLKDAIVPSYLYLWVFRSTSACGAAFYDCVHVGNSLFFVGSAPFVYMVAREVAGRALAVAVALMATLAPLNLYTAFFMPEAMYYFGFWVLAWVCLTRGKWPWIAHALAAGAVLGMLSLVKVHALFLLPALCLFLLYAHWVRGGAWLGRALGAMAVAAAAVLAVKFALGYALAGEAGLSLFGQFYSVPTNAVNSHSLRALLAHAFVNGSGHLMALAVLMALPLALLAQSVLRPPARADAGKPELLKLFALLMLGSALTVTVAYTATIAQLGLNNEGLRLHLRYYTFAFPLLWIGAAAAAGKPDHRGPAALRWAIALLLSTLIAIALFKLRAYTINPVDAPDLSAFNLNPTMLWTIAGIDLVVLLLWALRPNLGAAAFLFAALPAVLACSLDAVTTHLDQRRTDDSTDMAAALVLRVVPPAERSLVTVAGTSAQHIMHAQFHIDNKDTALLELPADAPIETYQLPVRNKWLVVLGHHSLPEGVKPIAPTTGYALVRMTSNHRRLGTAALFAPFGQGLIASAEGLSHAEPPWGRWSDGKQVVIHFNAPLPKHLSVIMKAQAYDVNTTLPFTMRVGQQSRTFRLGWGPQEVRLLFETDGAARSLTIDVPHPVAPSERGKSSDARTLGIGISEIEIGTQDN